MPTLARAMNLETSGTTVPIPAWSRGLIVFQLDAIVLTPARAAQLAYISGNIGAFIFKLCTFSEPLFFFSNTEGWPVHKLDSDHESGLPKGRRANVIQLHCPVRRLENKDEYGLICQGQKKKGRLATQKVFEPLLGRFLLFSSVSFVCGVYRTCFARALSAYST